MSKYNKNMENSQSIKKQNEDSEDLSTNTINKFSQTFCEKRDKEQANESALRSPCKRKG